MAATAPVQVTFDKTSTSGPAATHALLAAVLRANSEISDVIFSPGRPPQVEVNGQLLQVEGQGLRPFTADDTRRIASDLIGSNKQAITILREQGSCDVSFGLPGLARFRVNVFIQRGSCAVVMRVIPTTIPDFASLGLSQELGEIARLRDGIVLVTGPRGSGKSSTLASLLDRINEQQVCHIITIEDPIEFLHNHKRATIHQRELHSDTPSFSMGLRAALRQAPRVILASELRDRDTMEMIIEAAETGHVILSTLNSVNTAKAIERMVSAFAVAEQASIRSRLSKTLRYVIAQRLIPRRDAGRIAVREIFRVNQQAAQYIESENSSGRNFSQLLKSGCGMQDFDCEIEKLVRAGTVDLDTGLAHASDPAELQKSLSIDSEKSLAAERA